jgi:hypothetical protein
MRLFGDGKNNKVLALNIQLFYEQKHPFIYDMMYHPFPKQVITDYFTILDML